MCAHPDWEGGHAGLWVAAGALMRPLVINVLQCWNGHALARSVKAPAVIAALQVAITGLYPAL